MNIICTCERYNHNGGVCNCLQSNDTDLTDTTNEQFDWTEEDEKREPLSHPDRITRESDDWFVQ